MASAPAPNASISANGAFWAPSRTRPLEPAQIAPDFSTTGNKAAARPPVMGSLGLPRATRFETTTRFTGPLLLVHRLTTIHQYGSSPTFPPIETKFGRSARISREPRKEISRGADFDAQKNRIDLMMEKSGSDYGSDASLSSPRKGRGTRSRLMTQRFLFHRRADAREIPAHRSAHRNVRLRPWRGDRPRRRGPRDR